MENFASTFWKKPTFKNSFCKVVFFFTFYLINKKWKLKDTSGRKPHLAARHFWPRSQNNFDLKIIFKSNLMTTPSLTFSSQPRDNSGREISLNSMHNRRKLFWIRISCSANIYYLRVVMHYLKNKVGVVDFANAHTIAVLRFICS